MIALIQNMSAQRTRELHEAGARNRLAARIRRRETPEETARRYGSRISIRPLDADGPDRAAVERVAGRDSAPVPEGKLLGAEFDGRLIAALDLQSGQLVADPFSAGVVTAGIAATAAAAAAAAAAVCPCRRPGQPSASRCGDGARG